MHLARTILMGLAAASAALLAPRDWASAQGPAPVAPTGQEYEITNSYETAEQASDESTASSRGRNRYLERVLAVRDGGIELEYDLPRGATAEDRARVWQLPARVFRPPSGPLQLLNREELETRLEAWLRAAKWTREICGRWIFTWNAFYIDCDPGSVLKLIEKVDLRSTTLREGERYSDKDALAAGRLERVADGADGARYSVMLEVDPEAVRRGRAEADVATGEITQRPVTLDAALAAHANETVSGRIVITFDADASGAAWRRAKVTQFEIRRPDGVTETRKITERVERRPVERAAAAP